MTSPTTLLERAPWALVIGGEPLVEGIYLWRLIFRVFVAGTAGRRCEGALLRPKQSIENGLPRPAKGAGLATTTIGGNR